MLARPGEARQTPNASQRRKKAASEDPNDTVRRLQRLPPNKTCADCSSKLTQCVNLNHGTFVCMACSGVHREFNHRVKGIGHSSFTAEDVAKLQHSESGNEAVNAKYLARFDPRMDSMKAPQSNNDLQHLRSWIKQKYIDKSWCERSAAATVNVKSAASSSTSKSSSSSSKSSSRRKPPVHAGSTTPTIAAADPFGFDSFAPSSASSRDTSWDAFGTTQATPTSPPAATFQADFGNMNVTTTSSTPSSTVVTSPAFKSDFGAMNQSSSQPEAASFQADFGNNYSQPTTVSMPPPLPQGQPLQQQQPSQGNFGQTPNQQPFHANYNQASMQYAPQQQQPPTPQQQQHQKHQQQPVQQTTFHASLHQGQSMQQQQQGNQHQPVPTPAPAFQANFDQLPQTKNMIKTTHQQQQQSFQANFSQLPSTMTSQQRQQPPNMNNGQTQTQNMQMQVIGGEMMMHQQASGMNVNFGQFPQPQQQTRQQMVNDQHGMSTPQQMPPVPQQAAATSAYSNEGANISQTPEPSSHDPFDAFDHLSLEPTNSKGEAKLPSSEVDETAKKPKNLQFTKFIGGQVVVYTNGEGSFMATVKKVHYDDELHPYYTIDLNGREKQTDDAHLSPPNGTMIHNQNDQSQPTESNSKLEESNSKLEETTMMLKKLSESQLLAVQQFIARLQSLAEPTPAPAVGMAQQNQNNSTLYTQNQVQQQNQIMGGIPGQQSAGMGSIPIQYQMSAMKQPYQGQGMTSNIGGMSTQMNVQCAQAMQQMTIQNPNMMLNVDSAAAQVNPSQAIQAQHLPNHSSIQPFGQSQPCAPSSSMAPMAPPPNSSPPNLPPVLEKEGNPFDVY